MTAVAIRETVLKLTGTYELMTVRQAFYKIATLGVVAKSEAGYKQVQKQILLMRREGILDWDFIADSTRWQRKPPSWRSADDFMAQMANTYRRNLWQDRDVRVEIWLEKDALAGVITAATNRWDVPLMVSRGQSSATFLYNAAKAAERAWEQAGVTTFIYAMYDHDGGGQRAARTIARDLPAHAPETPIIFERLAVTEEQITKWHLPTRPANKKDPQADSLSDVAVELDAIDPPQLVSLVEDAITRHIDEDAWRVQEAVEAEERRGIRSLLERRAA